MASRFISSHCQNRLLMNFDIKQIDTDTLCLVDAVSCLKKTGNGACVRKACENLRERDDAENNEEEKTKSFQH